MKIMRGCVYSTKFLFLYIFYVYLCVNSFLFFGSKFVYSISVCMCLSHGRFFSISYSVKKNKENEDRIKMKTTKKM